MYKGYIYCITNKVNGKKYVGQTIQDYEVRWNEHIWALNKNEHINKHLQSAWNIDGQDNFEFTLLETIHCNTEEERKKELDKLEIYYIDEWNLLDRTYGYNIKEGGSNGNPFAGKTEEEMDEFREKQRQSHLGKKLTDEHKEKLRRVNLGKTLSEETKEKMSKARLGNKHTEEARKKMSKAKLGNKHSLGHKHTKESKEKMSKANLGKRNANGCNKPVINITEMKVFNSAADANVAFGKSRGNGNIRLCCRGINKTAYGCKWAYITIIKL